MFSSNHAVAHSSSLEDHSVLSSKQYNAQTRLEGASPSISNQTDEQTSQGSSAFSKTQPNGNKQTSNANILVCPICNTKFANEFNLTRHTQNIHGDKNEKKRTTASEKVSESEVITRTPIKTRSKNERSSVDSASLAQGKNEVKPQDPRHSYGNKDYRPGRLNPCCSQKQDPKQVCPKCISDLLDHHKPLCARIRSGACPSKRHNDYRRGGRVRRNLDFQIYSMKVFSDQAPDVFEEWMFKNLVKNGNVDVIDHSLRVLQMELFMRIYADVTHCVLDKVEDRMLGVQA